MNPCIISVRKELLTKATSWCNASICANRHGNRELSVYKGLATRRDNFFLGTLMPQEISIENRAFCFTTLPVQVVPSREDRAACRELGLFRETLDEEIGYRSLGLRGHFAFLSFGEVSGHCSRLGEAMRVSKARF